MEKDDCIVFHTIDGCDYTYCKDDAIAFGSKNGVIFNDERLINLDNVRSVQISIDGAITY